MSILALNYTFLDQNRLKLGFSNLSVLQKGLQDWVFILGPKDYPSTKFSLT